MVKPSFSQKLPLARMTLDNSKSSFFFDLPVPISSSHMMIALQIYFATIFVVIAVYTAKTISLHGTGLFPIFFGDMASFTWPGQFNTDFFCFLTMSALWLTWRHNFTLAGFGLGICGLVGGSFFLSAYLFWAIMDAGGELDVLFLGHQRVRRGAYVETTD